MLCATQLCGRRREPDELWLLLEFVCVLLLGIPTGAQLGSEPCSAGATQPLPHSMVSKAIVRVRLFCIFAAQVWRRSPYLSGQLSSCFGLCGFCGFSETQVESM